MNNQKKCINLPYYFALLMWEYNRNTSITNYKLNLSIL